MTFDIEHYREDFEGLELSDAQIADFIRSVWTIMEAFADLAWGTDATQIALDISNNDRALKGPRAPECGSQFNERAGGAERLERSEG